MRVAILSWESMYTIRVGGLALVVSRLAEELARVGHDVAFFTRAAPGQPRFMKINGVSYHTVDLDQAQNSYTLAGSMSRAFLSAFHLATKHGGAFDVVHGHDWLVVDALEALKREGYPIVFTFHSTAYGRNGGALGDWWEFKEVSDRERYASQMADRVTTVSESMRREINFLYGLPPERIDVVRNGIDPASYRFAANPSEVKRRCGVDPLAPMILYVGRLEYQKGPDILLESIPKILRGRPEARFLFAGRGGMMDYLQRRRQDLGVEDATRFLGFLPELELLRVLNSCDLVCLPSRNEPFGMVLLEAWAAGKPVVASDVGGLAENIDESINGLKVEPDPEAVASGVLRLLNSPSLMEALARAGEEKVRLFTWKEPVRRLTDIYAALAGSSDRR